MNNYQKQFKALIQELRIQITIVFYLRIDIWKAYRDSAQRYTIKINGIVLLEYRWIGMSLSSNNYWRVNNSKTTTLCTKSNIQHTITKQISMQLVLTVSDSNTSVKLSIRTDYLLHFSKQNFNEWRVQSGDAIPQSREGIRHAV